MIFHKIIKQKTCHIEPIIKVINKQQQKNKHCRNRGIPIKKFNEQCTFIMISQPRTQQQFGVVLLGVYVLGQVDDE